MRIETLALHPEWVATIADWHFQQWGELTGSESREGYRALLDAYAQSVTIPSVLVAFSGADLLGSASLIRCDMTIRAELTPWLAQLFVAPGQRRHGTGAALVHAAVRHAQRCGFARLYLYTSGTLPELYARLGWVVDERVSYLGKERTIMHCETA